MAIKYLYYLLGVPIGFKAATTSCRNMYSDVDWGEYHHASSYHILHGHRPPAATTKSVARLEPQPLRPLFYDTQRKRTFSLPIFFELTAFIYHENAKRRLTKSVTPLEPQPLRPLFYDTRRKRTFSLPIFFSFYLSRKRKKTPHEKRHTS